jgi:Tol biopolymer transport system component
MTYPRRILPLLILSAALALPGLGQNYFFPYYGKNKIVYEKFAWKSYDTEHFQLYFYNDDMAALKNLAETAESAYRKVSQELKYQLKDPVPLIFYTTYTDFEQTNIFEVGEGVLGVSEPVLHRIGIHGDMAIDEMQSLITHELTHIFEFDILWGNQGAALYAVNEPPLWIFEGLSEYFTGVWSAWSTLILRDTVINDRIPEFSESGELFARYPMAREPAYDFGHALYEFMEFRFGKNAAGDFFKSLKGGSPLLGKRDPLKKAFNLDSKAFSFEFKKYLRERFKEYYSRENPEDYSLPIGPEFPMNPYYFAFSHAVSPSGDLVATITFNAQDGDVDIVLMSTKDGKILKNLTKGYTSQYESIRFEIDPSLGKSLAWSRDGDRLAFFARDGEKHSLFIIDAFDGSTIRKIKVPDDQPVCPTFYPDGRKIMFSAFKKGIRDIFELDLATGQTKNLTRDPLYQKAPMLSPDGKTVVYSIRVDSYDKLFLSPVDDFTKKKQLTFGKGNTVTPEFSADGKTVFFSGDAKGAYNIYALNLESGELRRFTDVRTGNFFPAPLPNDPQRIIFSSFNKGAFQLFKSAGEGVAEQTLTFADIGPDEKFKMFEPPVSLEIDPAKIQEHNGMGKLYVASRPPVDAIVSTDGSIYGGSSLAFTDLLGNHTFSLTAYQVREFRSMYLGYFNQRNRFQWAINAFQYTVFYYPNSYYYDPSLWNFTTYSDAIATRRITGASAMGVYPLNKYVRAEGELAFYHFEEDFLDPQALGMSGPLSYGYFMNGDMLSASFSLTGETTHFKQYGPAAGHTFRLSIAQSLPVADAFIHNTTFEADLRKYFYLGSDFLLAFRVNAFLSGGRDPFLGYYGGNNQVRSVDFYMLVATKYWFANAEIRFPLVDAASTIIGMIGPVRGVLFFDITRSQYGDYPAKFYRYDAALGDFPYHVLDAIGSFGGGLELFVFGYPIHVEFAKRLEWPSLAAPFSFNGYGSYTTRFWIGFDF